jgi:hypothetical protein
MAHGVNVGLLPVASKRRIDGPDAHALCSRGWPLAAFMTIMRIFPNGGAVSDTLGRLQGPLSLGPRGMSKTVIGAGRKRRMRGPSERIRYGGRDHRLLA